MRRKDQCSTGEAWGGNEVAAISRGIAAILECPDVEAAAREVVVACRRLLAAPVVTVGILPEDGGGPIYAWVEPDGRVRSAAGGRTPPLRELRAALARVGPGFVDNEGLRSGGLPILPRRRSRVKNLLVAPMALGGSTVGVICLGGRPGGFTAEQLLAVASFGSLAASAHQRCAVTESLEERVGRATLELTRANAALHRRIEAQRAVEAELRAAAASQRLLARKLLTLEERERKRIARELHDSLGQTLTALKYRLEEALVECGACPGAHAAGERLRATAAMLGGAIREVRSVVMDLRPTVLDDLGLLAALRWLAAGIHETHRGLRVACRFGVGEREVPERLKFVVFRLVQEALGNAARHSGAGRVSVGVSLRAGRLEVAVRDNGRGFVPGTVPAGFGLLSMKERTELAGGTFTVSSGEGRGTVVRASWPTAAGATGVRARRRGKSGFDITDPGELD